MKTGYVRVSTNEQTPGNQIVVILKHGVPQDNIFVDKGVSGMTPPRQRPGFKALLEKIRLESTDTDNSIVVYELSRLGRSFYEMLNLVLELEQSGITIISLSPKESFLNTMDPSLRKLITAIFAWVAERERELIVERTKLGIAKARNEGKRIGRPPREIDWKTVDEYLEKNIPLTNIAKLMDIPYWTLVKRNRDRKSL